MTSRTRLATALAALAAAGLLIAGCASAPGTDAPSNSPSTAPTAGDDTVRRVEAALLDGGRMVAVVTGGSSTCIPQVEEVKAEGQRVSVILRDGDAKVCTADMALRASVSALPEGVDPTQDITIHVSYKEAFVDVELDGDTAFTAAPGTQTDYAPSAGWYDDGGLVLLTWGSSGCPPVVESVEGAGTSGTVTFVTDESQMCTMDMAPRATLIAFDEDQVEDDGFILTLVGGGLDGEVAVRG